MTQSPPSPHGLLVLYVPCQENKYDIVRKPADKILIKLLFFNRFKLLIQGSFNLSSSVHKIINKKNKIKSYCIENMEEKKEIRGRRVRKTPAEVHFFREERRRYHYQQAYLCSIQWRTSYKCCLFLHDIALQH